MKWLRHVVLPINVIPSYNIFSGHLLSLIDDLGVYATSALFQPYNDRKIKSESRFNSFSTCYAANIDWLYTFNGLVNNFTYKQYH